MAFQSGNFASGDDFQAVYNLLKAFATADGWQAEGSYAEMTLSKGITYATLNFNTGPQVDDGNHTGGLLADYHIESFLSRASGAPGPYPASMANYPSSCNDWTGPYSRYWLFSGAAGDPEYIYLIVQKTNGNFCCFMVGRLDSKGVDNGGGSFINGVNYKWWFPTGSYLPNNGDQGSDTGSDPFTTDQQFPGDQNSNNQLFVGDIVGAQVNPASPQPFVGYPTPYNVPFNAPKDHMLARGGHPTSAESYGVGSNRWLGDMYWLGPNPVNGVTPLFEVFEAIFDNYNGSNHYIYLGAYPGYRACSMIGRVEAEQVTFGPDEWLVFPIKRYQPYIPEPFDLKTVTSGPYAHAFKINN